MASAAARLVTLLQVKGVGLAVIRRWQTRDRNCAVYRRQQPHVCNDRAQILLVEVGKLVPGHALPVKLPTVSANAAANRAFQFCVGPGADSGLGMRGDVARPQRTERLPTDRRSAATVGAVTDGAAH